MLNTGFSPWPNFSPEEIDAAVAVLASNGVNYWTGNVCREFEREFAAWVGTEYAVALANGTLALDVAMKALDIGPGDEVVVTSRTFLASASSIVLAGAVPVFADVDAESQNITAETISAVLTEKTKAILCVHLAGWPCDMDPIMQLARERGLSVIEDCAQAHGAYYKGRSVGTIGDVGAWSFCQDKIMSTGGEGGMVTTSRRDLWARMWSYKDHGKNWEAVYERKHPPGFRWVHESFGTNWRMLELQAAIGRIQLQRLPDWHRSRQENALRLAETLAACEVVRVPWPGADVSHAWYKFYAFIKPEALASGWSRDRVMAEINAAGVPCYAGSCSEVYLEKAFDGTGWRPRERLPVARTLGETSLMWLVHPSLSEAEMYRMAEVSRHVLLQAGRNAS